MKRDCDISRDCAGDVVPEADPEIAVLMATYNGARYLAEQLSSLQAQTYKKWRLYVRDDSSTDDTVSILNSFIAGDERIVLLPGRTKLGARDNFMSLLSEIEAEYYMFCDQDDVWLPEKMEVTLRKMRETENRRGNCPVVVHTDLKVVDARLNELCPSFWEMARIKPELLRTFNEAAGHNLVTGCTMMLNRQARAQSFPVGDAALMHDVWITLCVLRAGGVVTEVRKHTMLYRQHGRNTIGANDLRSNYLMKKMRVADAIWKENRRTYGMLRQLGYGSVLKYMYYKIRYYVKS